MKINNPNIPAIPRQRGSQKTPPPRRQRVAKGRKDDEAPNKANKEHHHVFKMKQLAAIQLRQKNGGQESTTMQDKNPQKKNTDPCQVKLLNYMGGTGS